MLLVKVVKLVYQKMIMAMFLCGVIYPAGCYAASYINRTRLVITESSADTTFDIINQGRSAVLVQTWIDPGNLREKPEKIKSPFLISPTLFKLDADKSYAIRIQLVGGGYPLRNDQESMFWTNVLEIPAKSSKQRSENSIQIAFRSRIKLFYRPSSIEKIRPEEAIKKIDVTQKKGPKGTVLILKNNSPLYITLLNIKTSTGKIVSQLPEEDMIPPLSSLDIPWNMKDGRPKVLRWIDDYGTPNDYDMFIR